MLESLTFAIKAATILKAFCAQQARPSRTHASSVLVVALSGLVTGGRVATASTLEAYVREGRALLTVFCAVA